MASNNNKANNDKSCSKQCQPRQMIGVSWHKQLGYPSPCACADQALDNWIRDFMTANNLTEVDAPFVEAIWVIHTLVIAVKSDKYRRPYLYHDGMKALALACSECADKFGLERTQKNLPSGISMDKSPTV